jgi:hypothetical protein
MVAVTFGAAEAGPDDWDDGLDVFVPCDEQPPAMNAVTMRGYVQKATCFIAWFLIRSGHTPSRIKAHADPKENGRGLGLTSD